uniref:Uncharacterized protein n=1 Tax=Strombidium rassoulzadegani TaxID=1082188 RepID=A0A7S3FX18_9SPIT|mmetsp:Transcript_9733/g.16395  ORF Transcript_9733/g.16395 Transcript_9733/m.16395 type:complete len:402 (+) Transcript_9733:237-1442(+)
MLVGGSVFLPLLPRFLWLNKDGGEVDLVEVHDPVLEVLAAPALGLPVPLTRLSHRQLARILSSLLGRGGVVGLLHYVTALEDWVEDASDSQDGEEGIDHGQAEDGLSGVAVVRDALHGEGVGHGSSEASYPHDELLLVVDVSELGPRLVDEEADEGDVEEPREVEDEDCHDDGADRESVDHVFEAEEAHSHEEEDQGFRGVGDRLIRNLEHLARPPRDVGRRINVQKEAIGEDGDDARELESVGHQVGDPGAHDHHGDLRVEVLLLHVVLLSLAQVTLVLVGLQGLPLLVVLVLIFEVDGLTLLNEGHEEGGEGPNHEGSDEDDGEVLDGVEDLFRGAQVGVLAEALDRLVHDDSNGVVKDALAEDDGVEVGVSVHLLENGKHRDRVSGRDQRPEGEAFLQ